MIYVPQITLRFKLWNWELVLYYDYIIFGSWKRYVLATFLTKGNLMDFFPIHIGMMLSMFNLSSHGFALGLFPQNVSYQLDVVHTYILISLSICNQCGTL